jgi:hypothetical protein
MSFNKGDKVRFVMPLIKCNVQIGDTGVIDNLVIYPRNINYHIKLDKNEEYVAVDSILIELISENKDSDNFKHVITQCECGQKGIKYAKHSDYCPLYDLN